MKKLKKIGLILVLGVLTQPLFAADECDSLGLDNALLGLCLAYTTEGNDCLYDGNNVSTSCAAICLDFSLSCYEPHSNS